MSCQAISIENYPTNNRFDISALSAVDNDANAELTYRLSPVKVRESSDDLHFSNINISEFTIQSGAIGRKTVSDR